MSEARLVGIWRVGSAGRSLMLVVCAESIVCTAF